MTTILLVEDTPELSALLQRELQAAGYQVRAAARGEQALGLFLAEPPDLVVLDWMLPGIDGMEVLRQMRRASLVPVLMLTARGDPIDRVVGLEAGADDYLVKPFNTMELLARVRALLRRVEQTRQLLSADRAASSAVLQVQTLRLEPDSHQAWLSGELLDLTRLEFDLLHLLMRNPGRTFNRNYLLETVWGQSYLEGDRSVDNTILRLRRKLGPLGDEIETVRGVGYRLRGER
jgi:DNA-binding response OmpR family regulator